MQGDKNRSYRVDFWLANSEARRIEDERHATGSRHDDDREGRTGVVRDEERQYRRAESEVNEVSRQTVGGLLDGRTRVLCTQRPEVPVNWLKDEWRKRGLLKRFQPTVSGCVGPRDLPNVVVVNSDAGSQWLGNITHYVEGVIMRSTNVNAAWIQR